MIGIEVKLATEGYVSPIESSSDEGFEFAFTQTEEGLLKAFQVLTDNLYSDKIAAVVRELSCNAWDAHVEAGTKEPFEVSLPTWTKQVFVIRDYGPGLCKEDIQRLYCTLFESNKTKSNAYTGCLGLGSKSPFAYTDSFTVESIHKGVKTTYAINKQVSRMPAVNVIATAPTNERSGLKIQVPCKTDFHRFNEVAARIYKYFEVVPNIQNLTNTIERLEYKLEFGKYKVHHNGTSNVIMGNVCYPIKVNFDCDYGVKEVLTSGVDFYLSIGDVGFEPGREGLSYDKSTISTLIGHANAFIKVYAKELEKELDACESLYDARIKAIGLCKYGVRVSNLKWKGQELVNVKNAYTQECGFDGSNFYVDSPDYQVKSDSYSRYDSLQNNKYFSANKENTYYEVDTTDFVGRIKDLTYSNGYSRYGIIWRYSFVITGDIDKFCADIGFLKKNMKKTSSLPVSTKVYKTRKIAKPEYGVFSGGVWKETKAFDPKRVVSAHSHCCKNSAGKYLSCDSLRSIQEWFPGEVYRTWDKEVEFTYWDTLQSQIEKYEYSTIAIDEYSRVLTFVRPTIKDYWSKLDNQDVKGFMDEFNRIEKIVKQKVPPALVCMLAGIKPNHKYNKAETDLKEKFSAILKKFPLLSAVGYGINNVQVEHLNSYLEVWK